MRSLKLTSKLLIAFILLFMASAIYIHFHYRLYITKDLKEIRQYTKSYEHIYESSKSIFGDGDDIYTFTLDGDISKIGFLPKDDKFDSITSERFGYIFGDYSTVDVAPDIKRFIEGDIYYVYYSKQTDFYKLYVYSKEKNYGYCIYRKI